MFRCYFQFKCGKLLLPLTSDRIQVKLGASVQALDFDLRASLHFCFNFSDFKSVPTPKVQRTRGSCMSAHCSDTSATDHFEVICCPVFFSKLMVGRESS